ncbi:MAG: patatin-like phospholipase family protein [Actinomycetota bacterium]
MTRALVLSGGGPVGIGWEAGVIAGLAAQGVDPALADHIVGTSAGSVVGAQVALGRDMGEVAERMRANAGRSSRAPVGASSEQMQALMQAFMELFTSTEPDEVKRAKIGAFALEAETMPEDAFLASFGHLADADWPRRYACTAVDAVTGEFVVWDESSGAPLGRAVASSCAVPGVFPPITVKGRRYVDGGMRSATNADLAKGHDRILVLSLMNPATMAGPMAALAARFEDELAMLRDAGGTVEVIFPDADAATAMGINLMDPSMVTPAAEAGERQGQVIADQLAEFWNG